MATPKILGMVAGMGRWGVGLGSEHSVRGDRSRPNRRRVRLACPEPLEIRALLSLSAADLAAPGLFDAPYCRATNPDVASAVARGQITALGHFVAYGQFEGRNPDYLFSIHDYLTGNPDVAAVV